MDINLIKLAVCISNLQFQTINKNFFNLSWGRNSGAWRPENRKHHK